MADLQKSGTDDSSGNVDQASTTKTSLDGQARKTVADHTTACGTDEFDVYTIETALPHVEWERIEESLRMSAGEQKKRWVSNVMFCASSRPHIYHISHVNL